MGGLTFGKDGDGNYGYYGADGSLIPFKSYIDLGIGQTFDIRTLLPNIDYQKLTITDFVCEASKINLKFNSGANSLNHSNHTYGYVVYGSGNMLLNKTYDNTTGILTASYEVSHSMDAGGGNAKLVSATHDAHVYLIR